MRSKIDLTSFSKSDGRTKAHLTNYSYCCAVKNFEKNIIIERDAFKRVLPKESAKKSLVVKASPNLLKDAIKISKKVGKYSKILSC